MQGVNLNDDLRVVANPDPGFIGEKECARLNREYSEARERYRLAHPSRDLKAEGE